MRRKRPLGDRIDDDRHTAATRAPVAAPPPPTARAEALLIAERLAALVEQQRAQPPAPASGPRAGGSTAAGSTAAGGAGDGDRVGGVVGARHSGRLLGNLLVTRGFIVESELNFALARQASSGDPIGQILVDLGLITDRDLVELLAEQLRMQVVDVSRVDCDGMLLASLSRVDAHRLAALPLRRVDGLIEVALAEPTDDAAVAELMRLLGAPLRLFLATRADIDRALERVYG